MIRLLDFSISIFGLIFLSPILMIIYLLGFFDSSSPLFKQERVGLNQKIFLLIKFRTMPINTRSSGTHLVKNIKLTLFGYFLRKSKLDELPQLINVLIGNMSLVGPRPCLLNQKKLISERKKRAVFTVKPGITGLGQIKGITMKTPTLLAKIDSQMIKQMNLYYYFYYILITLLIFLKKK